MKNKKIIALFITCLLLFTVVTSVEAGKSKQRIIYIDTDGQWSKKTIQQGVRVARPGDTVFVCSGTYYENVVINKPITLIGEDKDDTIIYGDTTYDIQSAVINVTSNGVIVAGFTVRGCDFGILLYHSSYCDVLGNDVSINYLDGIRLDSANYNTIFGNMALNEYVGIRLQNSSNNMVQNNTASNMIYSGHGILLETYSSSNTITGNVISNNYYGISFSPYSCVSNLLYSNYFSNNLYDVYDG